MNRLMRRMRSITARLMLMFAVLMAAFALTTGLTYNALMRRQSISHHSLAMQRDAFVIAQNLSELIAPSAYDTPTLDETRFIVSEDTLAPYLALTEQITRCNVYLVDAAHNVTGYFDGVVQVLKNPLLPGYLEQSIALGFMGKTPSIHADYDGDTHLTACMPVMNAQSRVLGVVLLEATLRELGFQQVPSATILFTSGLISFALTALLALAFSHLFTRPIAGVEQVAVALAAGEYGARTRMNRQDEVGTLARSMDILARRLEEAHGQEERRRQAQQRLFSNISHELKTPVTVIRGSLEALRDGVVTAPEAVEAYYAQMLRESRWMQRLIQDLLELSRLQSDDFTLDKGPVDLFDLLGDAAMSARALCSHKGVRFSCEEPQAHYLIMGDYTRLRQMLMAVVDNAVKFTPPGRGVRLWLDAQAPVIGVEDEGEGIAAEELPLVFERFRHTRDPAREGAGLGLAIVREIARRHEVKISVKSEPGSGTVFLFDFERACSR